MSFKYLSIAAMLALSTTACQRDFSYSKSSGSGAAGTAGAPSEEPLMYIGAPGGDVIADSSSASTEGAQPGIASVVLAGGSNKSS